MQFSVPLEDLKGSMESARASQGQSDEVVTVIRDMKKAFPELRVFAMSNISRPDYEIIRAKDCFDCWDIFDKIFTSWETGMAKPELRFYRHVLESAGASPHETLFVDNDETNVLAARSLGFYEAIVFEKNGHAALRSRLFNAIQNNTAAQRGRDWLWGQASETGCLYSELSTCDFRICENFSQLILYEILGDEAKDLLHLGHDGTKTTWNYFIDSPFGHSGDSKFYPDDVDTTSYALKLSQNLPAIIGLPESDTQHGTVTEIANSVLDRILSPTQKSADGVVKVYFDALRNRVDPTVCVNVVRLFFTYDRGSDPGLQPTWQWIKNVLLHRAYMHGTRYYHTPEAFLYFFGRLLHENPTVTEVQEVAPLLRERISESVNSDTGGDAMTLAMRLLAGYYCGLSNRTDTYKLLALQHEDGSFGTGWLCRYGKSQVLLGSRFLTAALAIRAIELMPHVGSDNNAAPALNVVSTPRKAWFSRNTMKEQMHLKGTGILV